MEWYCIALYMVVIWLAVLITLLGFPGPFVIAAAAGLAGWATHWEVPRLWLVILFFVLALLAEILEQALGAASARSYGSTRAGMWGSIIGGVTGALMGVPVPLIGSLLGAFLGAFLGAILAESLISKKSFKEAIRAGYGAFRGRVGAIAIKTLLALCMAVTASFVLWRHLSY